MFAIAIIFLLLTPPRALLAQAAGLESIIGSLPECALQCLVTALPKSPCALDDLECLCTNEIFNTQLSVCVSQNCTVKEALTSKNATATACGLPIRDRKGTVVYPGMIGMSLAITSVVLRTVHRLPCMGGHFGLDDMAIIASAVVMMPLSILAIFITSYGLGKDVWTVPFHNITNILHIYFFDEMMYITSIALTRISILLLYLRIFSISNRFRRVAHGLIIINIGYAVAFDIAFLLQCHPISLAWKGWDGEHEGVCLSLNAIGWSAAGINITLDLATVILPLPPLAKLTLSWHKKLPIILLFLLGLLVTTISCIRLQCMAQYGNTKNVTWDYTPVGYWSTLEIHLAIIVACLPVVRALIIHRISKLAKPVDSTQSTRSYATVPSNNGSVHLEDLDIKVAAKSSRRTCYNGESDVESSFVELV